MEVQRLILSTFSVIMENSMLFNVLKRACWEKLINWNAVYS